MSAELTFPQECRLQNVQDEVKATKDVVDNNGKKGSGVNPEANISTAELYKRFQRVQKSLLQVEKDIAAVGKVA